MTKRYITIFNFVALSILVFIGVDLVYKLVGTQLDDVDTQESAKVRISPVKHYRKPSLSSYRAITDRNIFGSVENATKDIQPDLENLEPTKLKLALLGTVVTDTRETTVAVIEETDKRKQDYYRVGESVKDAVLKVILRGKVVLRVGDKDEILTQEESSSRRTSSPAPQRAVSSSRTSTRTRPRVSTRTIRRSDIQRSISDINSLLSQAQVRSHTSEDGSPGGLSVSNIKAGSIYAKMGLRNGDVVQGVSGNPITSPDDILSLYEELKSGSNLSIQIMRNGRELTLNYRLR
jgi:general secretion pathway protein C